MADDGPDKTGDSLRHMGRVWESTKSTELPTPSRSFLLAGGW